MTGIETTEKKKRSGCSCLLMGCGALMALILLPVAAGFVALSMVSDEFYGEKIMLVLKHPAFMEGIKEGIEESSEMSEKEKKVLLNFYDQLVSEYDKLPPEKQQLIHKNMIVVIKKAVSNPQAFEKEPPKEFQEMIQILGYPELDLDKLQEELKQMQQNMPQNLPSQNPASTNTESPANGVNSGQQPKPDYDF